MVWVWVVIMSIILYLCHPVMVVVFYPISVENRIWGDGNGTCQCDADGSRLLSGAMLEAYD
jgi:hypothetical protein